MAVPDFASLHPGYINVRNLERSGNTSISLASMGGPMGRSLGCAVMTHLALLLALMLALMSSPATAQDVPGLETCTAEKQMERRTGCLQSNDDFLAQTLSKLSRETQTRLAASGRELAAARAEIATLKSAMEKLNGELAQLKAKVEASGKK
jgi:hypothetical protein